MSVGVKKFGGLIRFFLIGGVVNMGYEKETRDVVEFFIEERLSVIQQELLFLGRKKQQIHPDKLDEILDDLKKEGKIRLIERRIGKRVYKEIEWVR